MYTYITQELPGLHEEEFSIGKEGLRSLSGHSMGGHGALTISLMDQDDSWASVSAFSPICNREFVLFACDVFFYLSNHCPPLYSFSQIHNCIILSILNFIL